ncbi:iron-containing alcohol dehydrogenase [Aspergillus saccharolyticus JOP 1030-1]|uniref:Dehydroquinate synthase-like protein n=1 Tax=Aspergillus saccharolyticus JOP 1030-1 TaxID=1450539 RepID=A0A318Z930_9EURO|nr:Dehydroquinate synthase-like protein [Aspergillus saccharolyticus JOP 1030-1]PYH42894.1 Dehydroquinate synthase-like protein [Aspergillus saccharolyticus JOP 1030-1]
MREKIQQLDIEGRHGHDAIFEASYLNDIPTALAEWNASRVLLVVSTSLDTKSSVIHALEQHLSNYQVYKKVGVGSHSPYSDIIDIAHRVQENDIQAVVSIGSGSYSDACKIAVMLSATLPAGFGADDMEALVDQERGLAGPDTVRAPVAKLICVPTSLSAGEWNAYASGTNAQGKKQHFMHPKGAPSLILMDPTVARTTPSHLWLASGMRAVDHFVESLCSGKCHEEAEAHIKKGLPLLVRGLKEYRDGQEDGKEDELLKGIAESQRGSRDALIPFIKWKIPMGASHAIGHQLGSVAGVQHGVTSCILLPPTLQFTVDKTKRAQQAILQIFNEVLGMQETEAADVVHRFVKLLGLPSRLSEVNVTQEEQLHKIAELTLTDALAHNKALPDKEGILQILDMAR